MEHKVAIYAQLKKDFFEDTLENVIKQLQFFDTTIKEEGFAFSQIVLDPAGPVILAHPKTLE